MCMLFEICEKRPFQPSVLGGCPQCTITILTFTIPSLSLDVPLG